MNTIVPAADGRYGSSRRRTRSRSISCTLVRSIYTSMELWKVRPFCIRYGLVVYMDQDRSPRLLRVRQQELLPAVIRSSVSMDDFGPCCLVPPSLATTNRGEQQGQGMRPSGPCQLRIGTGERCSFELINRISSKKSANSIFFHGFMEGLTTTKAFWAAAAIATAEHWPRTRKCDDTMSLRRLLNYSTPTLGLGEDGDMWSFICMLSKVD
jgi:hypothetical protein